jgi:hypothetical protein
MSDIGDNKDQTNGDGRQEGNKKSAAESQLGRLHTAEERFEPGFDPLARLFFRMEGTTLAALVRFFILQGA